MKGLIAIIFFFIVINFSQAQRVSGYVRSAEGVALPGVNVYIKNTNTGVISDENGYFILPVSRGKYVVVFRMLGYETLENEISIQSYSPVTLDAVLHESALQLNEAIVVADNKDLARSIMKNVRDKRRDYLKGISDIRYYSYRRQTMVYDEPRHLRDSVEKAREDSIMASMGYEKLTPKEKRKARRKMRRIKKGKEKAEVDTAYKDTARVHFVDEMNEILLYTYKKGNRYFEEVIGENEYKARPPDNYVYISIGDDVDGLSVDNIQYVYHNPYMLFDQAESWEFDFYKNTMKKDMLSAQPLVSPLSSAGAANYKYVYSGLKYIDSNKVFILKIDPVFPNDALFEGYISFYEGSFAIDQIDLEINPGALLYCESFHIHQKYAKPNGNESVPVETLLKYRIKDGKRFINTSALAIHVNSTTNPDSMNYRNKSGEIRSYDPLALELDSAYWDSCRIVPLSPLEMKYSDKIDSLREYYASDEYFFRIDSSYNHISILRILFRGIGKRNRKSQIRWYVNPIISQINPLGIGGYRHNVSGSLKKRFNNDFLLETDGMIDYGFKNQDIRGRFGLGLTYVPQKFVRTFFRFGDYYDMVNTGASISQIFSRSNYVRTQTCSVSQRMEIVNGLFAELTWQYSDQNPLTDLQLTNWSNSLFGDLNDPIEFDRYTKSELRLDIVYRIKQQYMMKGHRKILLGSKWPDIKFTYRKGVPRLFNSEVDFDYFQIGVEDYIKLNRWGTSNYAFSMGSFVNRTNLRVVEYKYFRGSDPFFFSNPTQSFQLLGPTLSSSSAFMQGNYIHHFDGTILGKVPLLSKANLSLAFGTGVLFMEQNHFRHFEFFSGIEKRIRIREEIFRLGVYAVTADNNFSDAVITWKIGINFFDSYSRKWEY